MGGKEYYKAIQWKSLRKNNRLRLKIVDSFVHCLHSCQFIHANMTTLAIVTRNADIWRLPGAKAHHSPANSQLDMTFNIKRTPLYCNVSKIWRVVTIKLTLSAMFSDHQGNQWIKPACIHRQEVSNRDLVCGIALIFYGHNRKYQIHAFSVTAKLKLWSVLPSLPVIRRCKTQISYTNPDNSCLIKKVLNLPQMPFYKIIFTIIIGYLIAGHKVP